MSGSSNSIVTKLVDRVFPIMPDFYGLIGAQAEQVCQSMDVFVKFMESGDMEIGNEVRAKEKEGDELKAKHMEILNHAFATPMDREDIYRAIVTIDEILNYAKTTVREIEALDIKPDEHMAEMARLMRDGSIELRDGYKKLSDKPMEAEENAAAARKAERNTEKVYRAALADLFSADHLVEALRQKTENAEADAMLYVIETFKRREVYRHLSNGADRLEHAAGVLHDIVVQIA
jgi:uncharacterized protein Yka (UPF0111/DUF47 family)